MRISRGLREGAGAWVPSCKRHAQQPLPVPLSRLYDELWCFRWTYRTPLVSSYDDGASSTASLACNFRGAAKRISRMPQAAFNDMEGCLRSSIQSMPGPRLVFNRTACPARKFEIAVFPEPDGPTIMIFRPLGAVAADDSAISKHQY